MRENLDRLRRCEHFGGIGSWDWPVGADTVYWSETIGPMFGYPAGEREIPVADLLAAIHPDDRARVAAATAACLRLGGPAGSSIARCGPTAPCAGW